MKRSTYHRINIDGCEMFYRQAGEPTKPFLLLLHGFPSSSHMFRDLMPLLADRFHLIAPDIPGFGRSQAPARENFAYIFDNLAHYIQRFIEVLSFERFALYAFDIGAPIGFRIAMEYPERVTAIISQNGNAYEEGLSDVWNPIKRYWSEPTEANRDALREIMKPPAIGWQYEHGVSDLSNVSPDGYSLDAFYMTRPDAEEIQLDIALDYANKHCTVSHISILFTAVQAEVPGDMGRQGSVLSACRRRSLQKGPAECGGSLSRYRPFCVGDAFL